MLLRLDKVDKFYGLRPVFRGVSLTLGPGERLLLAGANGAGKSTLLRVIAGLSRPSAGKVSLDLPEGAPIGYIGHRAAVYPGLNGLENLRFWARMHGLRPELGEMEQALDRVGLLPFAGEKAGSFSRGMAQRLSLARLLLLAPPLFLLDEPYSGLDTRSRALLRAEAAAAAARGAGLIWVSHNLEEDLAWADKAALLEGGRLAFWGSAAEYAGREGAAA